MLAELRAAGHEAVAVDLPSDDPAATLRDYAAAVPPADVVVGHSLGGLTIPLVEATHHVYLCAFVPPWGRPTRELFAESPLREGFPDRGVMRDDDGRSVWIDEPFARESLYADCDPSTAAAAYARLRPQSGTPYEGDYPLAARPGTIATSIVATQDMAIDPAWSRRVAPERLGAEAVEISGSHSPMLARPAELTALLTGLV